MSPDWATLLIRMTTMIDMIIMNGNAIAADLAAKHGLPVVLEPGNSLAAGVVHHGLHRLVMDLGTWGSFMTTHSGSVVRVSVACGLVSFAARTMWRFNPVSSILGLVKERWQVSVYEGELRRQFAITAPSEDDGSPSTLDLVLDPCDDVEFSYDFTRVEVPHNGGTQDRIPVSPR